MAHDKFTLAGQDFPLRHLRGFRVVVPAKEPLAAPATLQVTFSCHVYSERWVADVHSDANRFVADGQERSFCSVRYGCSVKIEEIVRRNLEGKVFWDRDGNGHRNPFFYGQADGIPYPIYFSLGRADHINGVDGLIHILSAYQRPDLRARHRFDAIKFPRLVHEECNPKSK